MQTAESLIRKIELFWAEKLSPLAYWETRARHYGRRAVLHLGHPEEEMETVTNMQKETLLPFFRNCMTGNERLILDFGCGPGRFTNELAAFVGKEGWVVGVDPINHFLDMAPKGERVEYRQIKEGEIPLPGASVDVVWCCLVLGSIKKGSLNKSVAEINRVLKSGGLLFLIENTSEKKDVGHWTFRTIAQYQQLFSFVTLNHLSDYYDLGERISIMAERKD